jgi:hypothetical protein
MHASPHFPDVQKKLNNNHLVAFIVAKVDIEAGEELLWKYDVSQAYRDLEPPTTPSPVSIKEKCAAKSGQGAAGIMRCAGCKCKNPCPSLKNCLTAQILPRKRGAAARENVESNQDRVKGCLCMNPCSNIKNCLTPQEGLKSRPRTARQLD